MVNTDIMRLKNIIMVELVHLIVAKNSLVRAG